MIHRHTSSQSTSSELGVSLVEMLVVLVIVASAYALTAPRTRGPSERVELRAVALELASLFKAARAQAVGHGRTIAVNFDTKTRSYAFEGDANRRLMPAEVTLTVTAARTLASAAGAARIAFFPDGSSSGGRVLLARGSQQIVVGVEWLTGATEVEALP